MARIRRARPGTVHRIAVVEDDPDLRESLAKLFSREGHEVRTAAGVSEAVELTRDWRPHLMLLDYFLGHETGADVVREIRTFDVLTQVLLVTGYASEKPARELLAELDIQGYHDKTDGPSRLMVLADGALKHYRVVSSLERQRNCLRHILDVSSEINRLQPPHELLEVALSNVTRLLAAGHGVIATSNSGLFVLDEGKPEEVAIHAASGQFVDARSLKDLPAPLATAIREGMRASVPYAHPAGCVIVPLETRANDRGCMLIDTATLPSEAIEACQIFAGQVVQALENVLLYERATVDNLTNLYNRAHGLQRLDEILRLASRANDFTTVILLDIDHFKALNDNHGHAAGDVGLRRVAAALKEACRSTDIVSRHGGEEFMVVLPATPIGGAEMVAEKLRREIEALEMEFEGGRLRVTVSAGIALAQPGEFDAAKLLACADGALYQAKRDGRNCIRVSERPSHGDAHHRFSA